MGGQPAVRAHKRRQNPCLKEHYENTNHVLVDDPEIKLFNNIRVQEREFDD